MGEDHPAPRQVGEHHVDSLRRKEAWGEILARIFWAGCACVLLGILALGLINGQAIRATQADNAAKIEQTHAAAQASERVLHILADCLTPGGRCYQRSQANTTDVLGKVKTIFEYVELCGKDPSLSHDVHGLDGCVVSLIKEHGL